jgi:hypothetical protein
VHPLAVPLEVRVGDPDALAGERSLHVEHARDAKAPGFAFYDAADTALGA